MRTVAREAAFEQNEPVDLERVRPKPLLSFKEVLHLERPMSLPPRQGDVRMEGPALRLQADLLTRSFDFRGDGSERRLGRDARPKRAAAPLLEPADSAQSDLESRSPNSAERVGEIVGDRPLDFTHEPQGNVELLVILPAEVRAVVHRVDQEVADRFGRPDRDEQPVHVQTLSRSASIQPSARGERSGGRSSMSVSMTASISHDHFRGA
jgi:hypothetical protein